MPGSGGSSGSDVAVAPEIARDSATSDLGGAFESAPQPGVGQAGPSVIRTGDISLEVSDPEAAADEVAEIAERTGGSVESMTVRRASGDMAAGADLALRVPEERIDEAFDALEDVGEVITQSRSAVDVTAQHVDLQARVAALEESVQRLTTLMAGADTTTELIEAESALSQRQQELDGLRAQLTALEGQVDEATIWVSLNTKSALPGGGPANFWEGLLAGIDSLAAAGAGALVVLGILLPWLAIAAVLALVIILIVRAASARRRARAAQTVRAAEASHAASAATAPVSAGYAAPAPGTTADPATDPIPNAAPDPTARQYPPTPPSSAL